MGTELGVIWAAASTLQMVVNSDGNGEEVQHPEGWERRSQPGKSKGDSDPWHSGHVPIGLVQAMRPTHAARSLYHPAE